MKYLGHIVPIAIFLIVLSYMLFYVGRPPTGGTISNVFAISSTIVIGVCFFLGPLSRVRQSFMPKLKYRKPLGLWGFLLATIHVAGALYFEYGLDLSKVGNDATSLILGLIAFIIFAIMTATSTNKMVQRLGYPKWKRLQRTGYLAFFLVLIHFTLVSDGRFVSRSTGQFLFAFVLLILLARILVIIAGKKAHPQEHEYHEFHGEKPAEQPKTDADPSK